MKAPKNIKRKPQSQAGSFFPPSIQRDPLPDSDDFQLQLPEFGQSLNQRPSLGFNLPGLELDPALQAKINALRLLNTTLQPSYLQQAAGTIGGSPNLIPKPNLFPSPNQFSNPGGNLTPNLTPPPTRPPLVPPGPGPKTPREGTLGDIAKAILGIPIVKEKVDEIKKDASQLVERQWDKLSDGAQTTLIVSGVSLAAGSATGLALMDPAQRRPILGPISGMRIPIPSTPLSFQYDQTDQSEQIMLYLDIAQIINRRRRKQ